MRSITRKSLAQLDEPPCFYDSGRNPLDVLLEIENMLGRHSTESESLPPFQRDTFESITNCISNPDKFGTRGWESFGRIDVDALKSEGYGMRRPRISISAYVTVKQNLTVRWHPGHKDLRGIPIEAPEWLWANQTEGGFERPGNELLFVRSVRGLQYIHAENDLLRKWIASALIVAMHGAYNWVVELLRHQFDVQVVNYLKVSTLTAAELGFKPSKDGRGELRRIAANFAIADRIEDERLRLAAVIDSLQDQFGITANEFWQQVEEYIGDGAFFHEDAASRKLRKAGNSKFTPSVTRKLHLDLTNAISAHVWSPPGRVVSLLKT